MRGMCCFFLVNNKNNQVKKNVFSIHPSFLLNVSHLNAVVVVVARAVLYTINTRSRTSHQARDFFKKPNIFRVG
jgi:hypothetical protein